MRELLKLVGSLCLVMFFPFFVVWITIASRLGVYSWLVMFMCLAPFPVAVAIIWRKRREAYEALEFRKPFTWNVEEKATELAALMDQQKAKRVRKKDKQP